MHTEKCTLFYNVGNIVKDDIDGMQAKSTAEIEAAKLTLFHLGRIEVWKAYPTLAFPDFLHWCKNPIKKSLNKGSI